MAGKMAQLVKELTVSPEDPNMVAQNPQSWKREPVPARCPLSSACVPGHVLALTTHKRDKGRYYCGFASLNLTKTTQ